MKSKVSGGFTYLAEILDKHGNVRDSEVIHNLMPAEGLNHMLGVTLKGVAQAASWYVGLFEGNYSPVPNDTAATFPASATESAAYAEATRVALTLGPVAGGAADNGAARSEFTFNADKTLYGGFISSASAKGATSGVLLSAVRFKSPKAVATGEILRVTAGFNLISI